MNYAHVLEDMRTWDGIVRHVLEEFDKEPTPAILLFELLIFAGTAAAFWVLRRYRTRIAADYALLAAGVVIFELFTAPMWNNFKLGVWAYVYKDVSWVLTLGWTTLILSTIVLVDRVGRGWGEGRRFVGYLVVLSVLVAVFETLVVGLGIRSYAPEVQEVLHDSYLPVIGISWHQLYYVPVFLSLVIAFYKYWAPAIERVARPARPGRSAAATPAMWLVRLGLALAAVFFFEVMVEPMVVNDGFPSWSYVYRDISVVLLLAWVLIIWVATLAVDALGRRLTRGQRFAGYLLVASAMALPLEAWLIEHGNRVYGPSAVANFSGLMTVLGAPLEVALGTPLYLALVVAFTRYWSRVVESGGRVTATVDEPRPVRVSPSAAPA